MAQTTVTAQTAQISTANVPFLTAVDAANGNLFGNPDGRRIIHFVNTGASGAVTAWISANSSYAGIQFPNVTAVVPSSLTGVLIGPFDVDSFNQSDGNVYIFYTGSAYRTTMSVITVPTTAT